MTSFNKRSIRLSFVVAAAVTTAACGGTTTDVAPQAPGQTCAEALAGTIELLQSGLPTYDYEPATNLHDLIRESDLVLTGTITGAQRTAPVDGAASGEGSWTSLTVEQPDVLFDFAGPAQPPAQIGIFSFWPDGGDDDPLADAVDFGVVRFVAFLDQWDAAPGGFAVDVQGLAVGCASSGSPSVSVIEQLPPEVSDLTIEQLAETSAEVGRSVLDQLSTGLDGPLVRHPATASSSDGQDAEISGVIELEGDCLYIQPDGTDERYPVVWPANTLWIPGRSVVLFPTRDGVGVTDRVIGGGGYGFIGDVEAIAGPEAAALVESCLDNEFGEVAIVNNQPDAIAPDR